MKTEKKLQEQFADLSQIDRTQKKRQSAKDQSAQSELRETATNEELINNSIVRDNNDNNDTNDSEPKEKNWRNFTAENFDSIKGDVLYRIAKGSLKDGVITYFTQKYNEQFANKLFESAKVETNNFKNIIVDVIDGQLKKGDHEIKINETTKGYSIVTDTPTTPAAICVIFNSFLTFALKNKLSCVDLITKEKETEKRQNSVNNLCGKIGINDLANIIANNPELLQAILATQK